MIGCIHMYVSNVTSLAIKRKTSKTLRPKKLPNWRTGVVQSPTAIWIVSNAATLLGSKTYRIQNKQNEKHGLF